MAIQCADAGVVGTPECRLPWCLQDGPTRPGLRSALNMIRALLQYSSKFRTASALAGSRQRSTSLSLPRARQRRRRCMRRGPQRRHFSLGADSFIWCAHVQTKRTKFAIKYYLCRKQDPSGPLVAQLSWGRPMHALAGHGPTTTQSSQTLRPSACRRFAVDAMARR